MIHPSNFVSSEDNEFDQSKNLKLLRYDDNGVLTLPNGVKIVSYLLSKDGNKTINETIKFLGYDRNELYFGYERNELDIDYRKDDGIFVGLWMLFTDDLMCIIRNDDKIMTEDEVDKYSDAHYVDRYSIDIITDLEIGIENKTIRQAFLEDVFGKKSINKELTACGYKFFFENGYLSNFIFKYSDLVKIWTFDVFKKYYSGAKKYYGNNEDAIIKEIDRQAECLTCISLEILNSNETRKLFAYSEYVVNFIAIAAYYDIVEITQSEFIDSTHGKYEILSIGKSNGIEQTKIKAYGKVFEFTVGNKSKISLLESEYNSNFTETNEGYVYVLINPSMEGLIKIGKTTKDPKERAREISASTGVATPFIVAYFRKFRNCHEAEKTVHRHFEKKGVRYNLTREFFVIQPNEAIDVILSLSDDESNDLSLTLNEYENISSIDIDEKFDADYYFNYGKEQFEKKNYDFALSLLKLASDMNHIQADRIIGEIFEKADDNYKTQILAYSKGVEKGDYICYARLGYLYIVNSEIRDLQKADEYWYLYFYYLSKSIELFELDAFTEIYRFLLCHFALNLEINTKYHSSLVVCREYLLLMIASIDDKYGIGQYLNSL